jgi:hypothetical protein
MTSRIRTIKPEWLEDEQLAEAGTLARLLSVGLIVLADDHGRGRANEVVLAAKVFTYEADPLGCIREALASLSRIDFVQLYSVRGQRYYKIRNWSKHQRIDRPSKPRFPGPEEADGSSIPPGPPPPSEPPEDPLSRDHRETEATGSRPIWTGTGTGTRSEDLARAPVRARGPEPGVEQRSLAAFGDEIRDGFAAGLENEHLPSGRVSSMLTWTGWGQIAGWSRERAALTGRDEREIAMELVRAFFASKRAKERGYPPQFLAQNPAEFLREAS